MLKDACGDHDDWRTHVESYAKPLPRGSIATWISLVWELRPTALDDLGLRAALANYVQDWSNRVGSRPRCTRPGCWTIGSPATRKRRSIGSHKKRSPTWPSMRGPRMSGSFSNGAPISVLLAIEDDGMGFDPAAGEVAGQGFGLLGMPEGAGLVGAILEIESSAGKGTTVLVRMAAGPREARGPDHV